VLEVIAGVALIALAVLVPLALLGAAILACARVLRVRGARASSTRADRGRRLRAPRVCYCSGGGRRALRLLMASEFSAGGVVVNDAGEVVVIVPTRRAADGSKVLALPKGHPDGSETAAEAALREVREETGVVAELVESLGKVRYSYQRDGRRIAKVVEFFLLRYVEGDLADHDHEVQEACWVSAEQAEQTLSYAGERDMVRRALSRPGSGR